MDNACLLALANNRIRFAYNRIRFSGGWPTALGRGITLQPVQGVLYPRLVLENLIEAGKQAAQHTHNPTSVARMPLSLEEQSAWTGQGEWPGSITSARM